MHDRLDSNRTRGARVHAIGPGVPICITEGGVIGGCSSRPLVIGWDKKMREGDLLLGVVDALAASASNPIVGRKVVLIARVGRVGANRKSTRLNPSQMS